MYLTCPSAQATLEASVWTDCCSQHPPGFGGTPVSGHRFAATAKASATASSARPLSPKTPTSVARARPQLSPSAPVYQAGTLSGNPLAMAAGLATLRLLTEPGVYNHLERLSARLADGLAAAARGAGVAYTINRVGSMWTLFFNDGPVYDWDSANRSKREKFARFFHLMLDEGVYLPPSQMESAFFSAASPPVISYTLPSEVRIARGRPALAQPMAQSFVSPLGILWSTPVFDLSIL